ncbi:MAG TPA: lytic transglycosylase domain-containing protein [Burkholderiales bacterium]|nr:lytic transglycosylase domain-containing protein [Burkholderiales bacterium]
MKITAALLAFLFSVAAHAGAQRNEPIDPVVLATLTSQIADRAAPFFNFKNPEDAHKWIFEMSNRLQKRIPDRKDRNDLLMTVQWEATRAGLDPQLVLGVLQVESGFRKYAISSAQARGYMQVMPFWTQVFKRPNDNLFNLRTNLRYGCVILRYYLNLENGDYFRALGRYNGSLGQAEYPNAVNAAWHGSWKYDGPTS